MSGFRRCVCASAASLLLAWTGCGADQPGGSAGAAGSFYIPVAGEGGAGAAGGPGAAGGAAVVTAGSNGGTVGAAGGGAGAPAGAAGADAATGEPKWSAIYAEVIKGSGCNGGFACHGGTVGNLSMKDAAESYTALVGVKAMGMSLMPELPNCKDSGLTRVIAGDPDNSLLMQKIEQEKPVCGARMPISKPLPPAQVQQIRTWIMNGALND